MKSRTPNRADPSAKPPKSLVVQPTPQEQWESERLNYERAREAYDGNERTQGYGWAQQNRIKVERYCRVAEQRTPAFVDGCMNYVRNERKPSG